MSATPQHEPAVADTAYETVGDPAALAAPAPAAAASGTDYAHIRFADSLRAGFIDACVPHDERFDARFLVNDRSRGTNLRDTLISYLGTCDRFDFSVAFVTKDGLESLMQAFVALEEHGVPGRFLTSTYQNFNDPDALEKLAPSTTSTCASTKAACTRRATFSSAAVWAP